MTDTIIVGSGLAGLVAAHELTSRGRTVTLVEQENQHNLGGQAFWSFGGLFLVDSPEQRRLRVKDSFELAWNDWRGSAQFDRLDDEDSWAVKWARAYVEFAAGDMHAWINAKGIRLTRWWVGLSVAICAPVVTETLSRDSTSLGAQAPGSSARSSSTRVRQSGMVSSHSPSGIASMKSS